MAKMVVELFGQDGNLLNHRTVVICLLAFSGFMRISKLVDIQVKHLKGRMRPPHNLITLPILLSTMVVRLPPQNRPHQRRRKLHHK